MDIKRIKRLNKKDVKKGKYILYWMQASQRVEYNHALNLSIEKANELNQPLIVFFGLTDEFPDANLRHYTFMLEGLKEVSLSLKEMGIKFVVPICNPDIGVIKLSRDASMIITDRGYLRIQKRWRSRVADDIPCMFLQVESDVVVPVEEVSDKEEYSAATIRKKIRDRIDYYLIPLDTKRTVKSSLDMDIDTIKIEDIDRILKKLNIDRSVGSVNSYHGGTEKAKKLLSDFIRSKLPEYSELSNDPSVDFQSGMSPYLHFGQISPLYIALEVLKSNGQGVDDYLEQLIIRRELSMNFVYYNDNYDSLDALPDWAKKTLNEHKSDRRKYVYTQRELENAKTHDIYWNSAQREMMISGKMHGYMRMYWSKKIIEWSKSPEEAFRIALYLNNKYELDGRDPNGFTGILWCFGKHDRAWKERPIFGKVRYMNAKGLERKFNIDRYVGRIENLT